MILSFSLLFPLCICWLGPNFDVLMLHLSVLTGQFVLVLSKLLPATTTSSPKLRITHGRFQVIVFDGHQMLYFVFFSFLKEKK